MIIVNAQAVHAGPVERALAADAAVGEAYVVGRPDEVTGEAVHAFVVPVAGERLEQCRKLVAVQVDDLAVPRTITVVDRVPLAPSGKPDKGQLAQRVPQESRGGHDTPRPDDPVRALATDVR